MTTNKQRIVSTAAELDALPAGSIIAADGDAAWTRHDDGWLLSGGDRVWQSDGVATNPNRIFHVLREGWGA